MMTKDLSEAPPFPNDTEGRAVAKNRKRWEIPPSGGRLGWPKRIVEAEWKVRGDPGTFTCITIEEDHHISDWIDMQRVSISLSQARHLLKVLPAAIRFAERKRR